MKLIEFMPAFIGLLGVVIGGLLQFLSQRHRDKNSQIQEIRHQCATLSKLATDFGERLVKMGRTVGFSRDEEITSKDWEALEELATELEAERDLVNEAAYVLEAGLDHRIAHQAFLIRAFCGACYSRAYPSESLDHKIGLYDAGRMNKRIIHETNILMNAVRPIEKEEIGRFKTPEYSGLTATRDVGDILDLKPEPQNDSE